MNAKKILRRHIATTAVTAVVAIVGTPIGRDIPLYDDIQVMNELQDDQIYTMSLNVDVVEERYDQRVYTPLMFRPVLDMNEDEDEIPIIDCEVVEEEDQYVIDITDKEYDVLAHIVMAEAGGEDFDGKVLVANVIINRVNSNSFPDDIVSVVYQNNGITYQFSPVQDGRIDEVIPTDDCYEAIDMALSGYDISQGALYFEACNGSSWHSRNLDLLFQHGNHRFYKEYN